MEKKLVSVTEAAQALNVSRDTVRRMIARRVILSVRVLRRLMIPVGEIQRICEAGVRCE